MKNGKRKPYPWTKIKASFVNSREKQSNDLLAERFGPDGPTAEAIRKRRNREKWDDAREAVVGKRVEKVAENVTTKDADEIARSILIYNTADEINLELLKVAKKDIAAAMKMKDTAARGIALRIIMDRPEVQAFVGSGAVDKHARGKKFLRVEPDSHVEISDRDRKIAAAYWKAGREQMEKEEEGEGGSGS